MEKKNLPVKSISCKTFEDGQICIMSKHERSTFNIVPGSKLKILNRNLSEDIFEVQSGHIIVKDKEINLFIS